MFNNINIIGVGSFVPDRVLTNYDIENMRPDDIEPENWTNDAWIFPRTGIRERRVAHDSWASSDLMVRAAKKALLDAEMTMNVIDLIVTSTSFPDKGFNNPRTSEIVKDKLGARQKTLSVCEDAACAGFTWALERACMEMLRHDFKHALVVSGDKVTSAVNYQDRSTCILFGDAAGAVILEKNSRFGGIYRTLRETNTKYIEAIEIPAGGSALPYIINSNPADFYIKMPGGADMLKVIGGEVIPQLYNDLKQYARRGEVKFIIPHQANARIIKTAKHYLKNFAGEVFDANIECFGNTSGSSVPLALDTIYRQGKLAPGDMIILMGFGAGFIYGANLIEWSLPIYKP